MLEPLNVTNQTNLGITIAIDIPEQAGADRLCNAVALSQQFGAPAVSVDFGTSTNFDVLSAAAGIYWRRHRAWHRLGARRPGQPRRSAAQGRTWFRPRRLSGAIRFKPCSRVIFWGYVGMIEALLGAHHRGVEFSRTTQVIATGGLSAGLSKSISGLIDDVAPEMTLDGLAADLRAEWLNSACLLTCVAHESCLRSCG